MSKMNAATNPVKLYVIKQVNPSVQSDDLFDELTRNDCVFNDNYPNMVINPYIQHTNVHGLVYNRHYDTMACELYTHVMTNLELALCDWSELDKEGQTTEELKELLDSYGFNPVDYRGPECWQHWTQEDLELWRNIFDGNNCADDDVVVMMAMELLSGHPWASKVLRGSGQSEWVSVLYDETMYTDDDLESLRCSYFNLGSEWVFCDDYLELAAKLATDPEDIKGYHAYFPKECPTSSEVKAWAADVINEPDCTPETIKLLQYAGERRVPYYTEA